MILQKRGKRALLVAIALIAGGGLVGYSQWDTIKGRIGRSERTSSILVSGNIEAHQAVLGFKTVQSRIVELPFNEGQWVKTGTLIARLEDADYRQQVAVAESALEVQQRQLAAAEISSSDSSTFWSPSSRGRSIIRCSPKATGCL
jgi:HlyD family secretion protein